ncbi:MAG: response regulator transcription factor [Myxococcales bacterium]|nr:response regulator transcription factor [Myxococcales bacterium]
MTVRALLIDDDRELARLLTDYFAAHDVTILHEETGDAGLATLAAQEVDVVLLDVMLPGIDGFEVCRRARAVSEVPIVMLTGRGDDADRITGLELGADDYLPKPFNPRELLARLRAVLRRAKPASGVAGDVISLGDLKVDVGAMTAELAGAPLTLTSHELRILVALARRAGDTVTREELAQETRDPRANAAAPYDPTVDRSLDVHVSRLRHKLETDPKSPQWIKTVRGIGYVLARPAR